MGRVKQPHKQFQNEIDKEKVLTYQNCSITNNDSKCEAPMIEILIFRIGKDEEGVRFEKVKQ